MTSGVEAVKSNAAYGRVILILVLDPPVIPPRLNVRLAFCCTRVWCKVSLTRYNCEVSFHCNPNAFSNNRQAGIGSQIYGSDESIDALIGVGNSPWLSLPTVEVIDSTCTAMLFVASMGQEPSCCTNLDLSYPPRVKDPKALPSKPRVVSQRNLRDVAMSYDTGFQQCSPRISLVLGIGSEDFAYNSELEDNLRKCLTQGLFQTSPGKSL